MTRPEFVQNGKLTDAGEKIHAHMLAVKKLRKGRDTNEIVSQAWRDYLLLVIDNHEMTPAEFMTQYPNTAATLWDSYLASATGKDADIYRAQAEMSSANPKVESVRLRAGTLQLNESAQDYRMETGTMDTELDTELNESAPLVSAYGHLTTEGAAMARKAERLLERLSEALPLAIPVTPAPALSRYVSSVVSGTLTPAQHFTVFAEDARHLRVELMLLEVELALNVVQNRKAGAQAARLDEAAAAQGIDWNAALSSPAAFAEWKRGRKG